MYRYILFFFVLASCSSAKLKENVPTAKVKYGEFIINLVEEGEVEAVKAINISSPAMSWRYGQLKITEIVDDGSEVAENDTVMKFDPSEVGKAIIDAEAKLEIAHAELEKTKAEQESRILELESSLKISEISHRISEIELEQSSYEADIKKREIQLNLHKAKISLKKARQEINNQKKIDKEEQKQKLLEIKQLEENLEDAKRTEEKLTVTSPAKGIAIIRKNRSTGSKWQVGDQPWSGNPIIDLPDMSILKINVDINEVDISKIKTGQKVEIRLDAFSDSVYWGKVTTIANLAKQKDDKSKIKVFPVEVLVESQSKQLLPGMTVSCKFHIEKIDNVKFIPLESVFKENLLEYVYLKSGASFNRKDIKLGRENNDYVIVEEGLDEDDLVALLFPFEEEKKEEEQ